MRHHGLNIVAVGGGTGLSTLLRGLKRYVGVEGPWTINRLGAIVTVTDEGGSSGELRRELGMLPPGDVRNCIVALAEEEKLLSQLFAYRFAAGEGLAGHSLGNLLLTAARSRSADRSLARRRARKENMPASSGCPSSRPTRCRPTALSMRSERPT